MRTVRMLVWLSLSLMSTGLWAQKTKPANGSNANPVAVLKAGLKGEYFDGPNFERKVMTRTDAQVDFNWNWQSPGPDVPREYFSVRWTGKLYAPTSGTYRFSATVDDGVRVWVGGKKVIDEWRKQDDSRFVGEISLNGNRFYDLRIEYYNDWKGSTISVFWESPEDRRLFSFTSSPHQVIPAKYLFSKPDPPRPAQLPTPNRSLVQPAGYSPAVVKREPAPATVAPRAVNRRASQLTAPKPPLVQSLSVRAKRKSDSVALLAVKTVQKSGPTVAAVTPELPKLVSVATADQPFGNLSVGEPVILRQVVFARSEYTLLPESYAELDKLVRSLLANPAFQIEIVGHTDNVGDKRLNLTLSEFRARVVATYLIRHGIADTRITAKGYGGSRPIADNTTETQRAQNRRVEFIVNR